MANARLYFVHALSPLHPGTGQGVGVIDLPIAREKATGIPYLPGSSVKGVLRDTMQASAKNGVVKSLFGPDTVNAAEHAGAAQFADARLLLLPIRSLRGTFAWVTSPYLLQRLIRDAAETGLQPPQVMPVPAQRQQALISGEAILYHDRNLVILEDLDLGAEQRDDVVTWATWIGKYALARDDERAMLKERLCIVHDDILSFLLSTATEVVARIRLKEDSKTVDEGALWYEEALPSETLLYGIIFAQNIREYSAHQAFVDLAVLNRRVFQFGGKATVGRGLCQFQIVGGKQ